MDHLRDESRVMIGTIRDLAALAALSADLVGGRPLEVAERFADLLVKVLSLDFAYLRLHLDQADGHKVEVARALHQPATEAQTREIKKALAPCLDRAGTNEVRSVTNPLGSGTVRVIVVPIGNDGEEGVLVVGSQQADFPGEEDRLLLDVVAKQAATALQCRRAEEARRRLQRERDEIVARRQLQFERMPIACIMFDPQLRIIDWNPAAEKLFGYRREDVVGTDGDVLLPAPSSRAFTQEITRRLASGELITHATSENVNKDGRTILCEWHITPVRDADGAVTAILGMAQDVTERTKNEEKLGRSESLLAEAQHLAHIGSWSWDIASGEVLWSDELYRRGSRFRWRRGSSPRWTSGTPCASPARTARPGPQSARANTSPLWRARTSTRKWCRRSSRASTRLSRPRAPSPHRVATKVLPERRWNRVALSEGHAAAARLRFATGDRVLHRRARLHGRVALAQRPERLPHHHLRGDD